MSAGESSKKLGEQLAKLSDLLEHYEAHNDLIRRAEQRVRSRSQTNTFNLN